MKLTPEQMETYQQQGVLFIPACFSAEEVKRMKTALQDVMAEDTPGRILEKDKKTVRALHGCHRTHKIFDHLTLHPHLLEPARQILATEEVYIYQFKINFKAAFTGDVWPWHQDFVFWDKEDGMPSPKALNVAVFLDEVNEFNGPIYFIPGSHQENYTHLQAGSEVTDVDSQKPAWAASFNADLKYTLDRGTILRLAEKHKIVAPKGSAGSILLFHSNVVHASVPNISPFDRKLVLVTYNSLDNIPVMKGEPRPDFLVGQDYTPLKPLADGALI